MELSGVVMTMVVKRNGKKERFVAGKIVRAIEAAAREANMPEAKAARIARDAPRNMIEYSKKEREIRSTTIRENILNRLDHSAPEISRAWRDFDRRTKGIS